MDTNLRETMVFWHTDDQGRVRSIDIARQDATGEWVSVYGRPPQNISVVQAHYPGARLGTFDEFNVEHDKSWRQPPTQVTEEDYWDALEVLPPVGYVIQRASRTESFKMRERQSGEMTAIYARNGDTYWHMMDNINTPHEKIMEAVIAAQEEVPVERPRM